MATSLSEISLRPKRSCRKDRQVGQQEAQKGVGYWPCLHQPLVGCHWDGLAARMLEMHSAHPSQNVLFVGPLWAPEILCRTGKWLHSQVPEETRRKPEIQLIKARKEPIVILPLAMKDINESKSRKRTMAFQHSSPFYGWHVKWFIMLPCHAKPSVPGMNRS